MLFRSKLGEGIALGLDPKQIIRELLDYLRQALLFVAGGQEPLLSSDSAQRLKEQSKRAGLKKLLSWINVILKGEGELKYASNARLAAEMILVQALYDIETCILNEKAKAAPDTIIDVPSERAISVDKFVSTATPIPVDKNVPTDTPSPDNILTKGENLFSFVSAKWPEILEAVRQRKKSTHAFLLEGKPMGVKGESLLLVFKEGYSFHRDKFNQPENKAVVEEVLVKS